MARLARLSVAREIVHLRRLQRQAAEAGSARACKAAAEAAAASEAADRAYRDQEQLWREAASKGAVNPQMAAAWGRALLHRHALAQDEAQRASLAAEQERQSRREVGAAAARVEGAERFWRGRVRQHERTVEEGLIQSTADLRLASSRHAD